MPVLTLMPSSLRLGRARREHWTVAAQVQTIAFVPQTVNLTLYAGDGATVQLTVTDASGAPLPLTGAVTAQIRAARTDPDPAAADFASDLSQGAQGIVLLTLTGADSAGLMDGSTEDAFTGVWDVEWTPQDAEPLTLLQGKVKVALDVTRP
jgi:hypothetical protein